MSKNSPYLWPILTLIIILGAGIGLIVFMQYRAQGQQRTAAQLQTQAEQRMQEQSYTESLRLFEQAMRLNPRESALYDQAASIYEKKQQYGQAEQVLDEGLSRSQGDDTLRLHKIANVQTQGKYELALDEVNKLSGAVGEQRVTELKTQVYLRLGDTEKATKEMEKFRSDASSLDISLWKVLTQATNPAAIAEIMKSFTAANQTTFTPSWQLFYRDYQQLSLNDEPKHLYLRTIISRLAFNERYDLIAQSIAKAVTDEAPLYDQAWVLLGASSLRLGQAELGLQALGDATVQNPSLPEPYWYRARYWVTQNDQAKAKAEYESAVALAENRNVPLLAEWGKQQQAWKVNSSNTFATIINLSKPEPLYLIEAYNGLAAYQITQKKLDDANTTINKGLLDKRLTKVLGDHSIDTSPLHCSQLQYLLAKNDAGKAREIANGLQTVYDTSACFHYWQGKLLHVENNQDQAKKEFQRAYDLDLTGEITTLIKEEQLL